MSVLGGVEQRERENLSLFPLIAEPKARLYLMTDLCDAPEITTRTKTNSQILSQLCHPVTSPPPKSAQYTIVNHRPNIVHWIFKMYSFHMIETLHMLKNNSHLAHLQPLQSPITFVYILHFLCLSLCQ